MKQISIEGRLVGEGCPAFVIAEAGANFHISSDQEVNFKNALKLIDIAADANADAVKFQLYRAEKLYSNGAGAAKYLGKEKPIYEIIQERELPYTWLGKLMQHCKKRGIIFLCSPFDEDSADELEKAGIGAYKIASYSIDNISFLRHVAKKQKPMLISTGASNLKEVQAAIKAVKNEGNNDIAVLQCTAKYPAPLSSVNLRAIPKLKSAFKVPVGLSDHSRDLLIAPLGAVALGACIIEKHFTTDNSLPGPDHNFAILPRELSAMVRGIRGLESALGSGGKSVAPEEEELRHFAKDCLYARESIHKGKIIKKGDIIALRPGRGARGISAARIDFVIGKRAMRDLRKGGPICENDCKA